MTWRVKEIYAVRALLATHRGRVGCSHIKALSRTEPDKKKHEDQVRRSRCWEKAARWSTANCSIGPLNAFLGIATPIPCQPTFSGLTLKQTGAPLGYGWKILSDPRLLEQWARLMCHCASQSSLGSGAPGVVFYSGMGHGWWVGAKLGGGGCLVHPLVAAS